MAKIRNVSISAFYVMFISLFGLLFYNVIFNNVQYGYKPYIVLPLAAFWFAVFCGAFFAIKRFSKVIEQREVMCLVIFFAVLTAVQLLFYWQVGAYPTVDLSMLYHGAAEFTISGTYNDPYLDYFYKYPHNLPLSVLLQYPFRVFYRLTGSTHFYNIGVIFNVINIDLAYLFTYLLAKKLGGKNSGFTALTILFLNVPLQCYISIYYTDTMSMMYIPFLIYMYLVIKDEKNLYKRAAFILALGVVLGFGLKIKYSVVLALVAVLIDALMRRPKVALAIATCVAAAFIAWSTLFNLFIYSKVLDKQKAVDEATPFTSWIMMSLKDDGRHDPNENYIIWAQPTKELKEQVAKTIIKDRLKEFGVLGYISFLNRKGVTSFGSGNEDVAVFVAGSPMRQTFLVECISANTPENKYFENVQQGYHIAVFLLVIAGAVFALIKKNRRYFVPHLSIFGLYVFLLIWEAGQRYLINYYCVIALAAAVGLSYVLKSPPPQHFEGENAV